MLTGLRDEVGEGPTLVLASRKLLADEHGVPYIAWELRGGRVQQQTPVRKMRDHEPAHIRACGRERSRRGQWDYFIGLRLIRAIFICL